LYLEGVGRVHGATKLPLPLDSFHDDYDGRLAFISVPAKAHLSGRGRRPAAECEIVGLPCRVTAVVAGHLLYTPIAYGVNGGHGRHLTVEQIVAHCIALAVVAILVAAAQRRALAPFASGAWVRNPVTAILFNILAPRPNGTAGQRRTR
jgi:hypothetical protein